MNDASRVTALRPDDPLLAQVIDGRYRIESILGEGGMGIVYRATHTALNKALAIKVLRPEVSKNDEIVARFRQEAQSASAIGNQHIIDISDFGVLPDGSTYFVMEFLEGTSLTGALEESRFSTERTIHVAKQLCNALGAAHDRGIVHRDMKPDNVQLIKRGGTNDFVKVLDFGIAKVGDSNTKLTQAGQVFGTPHYMSPEQCAGSNVDHRTDIYAVGVILYEMGTGQVPFDADNLMGILTKHLYENPIAPHELSPPTDVPAALEAVIMKCLAKQADQRYQSMSELLIDLEAVETGTTPRAVVERVDRQSRTGRNQTLSLDGESHARLTTGVGQPAGVPRRPLLPIVVGALVVVAAGVVGVLALSSSGTDPEAGQEQAHVVAPAGDGEPAPGIPEGDAPAAGDTHPEGDPPTEGDAPAAAETAQADDPPEPVRVRLDSDPPGAEVYRDGDLVGVTPFEAFKPAGNQKVRYLLKHAGYEDKSVLVRALSPEAISVRLDRVKKRTSRPRRPASADRRAPKPDKKPASNLAPPPTTEKPKARVDRLKSEVLDPWD